MLPYFCKKLATETLSLAESIKLILNFSDILVVKFDEEALVLFI